MVIIQEMQSCFLVINELIEYKRVNFLNEMFDSSLTRFDLETKLSTVRLSHIACLLYLWIS